MLFSGEFLPAICALIGSFSGVQSVCTIYKEVDFFWAFFVLFLVCFPRVVGTWRARGERKRERKLKIIRKNCTTAIVLMEIKKNEYWLLV